MKKLNNIYKIQGAFLLIANFFLFACSKKVEPIHLEFPERNINTSSLETYKSNLADRKIAVGYLSNWGVNDASILFHTPDSLDLIVLMDHYTDLTEYQQKDLQEVRTKKATKVLMSYELPGKFDDLPNIDQLIQEATADAYDVAVEIYITDFSQDFSTILDSIRNVRTQEVYKTAKTEIVTKIMNGLGKLDDAINIIDRNNYDGLSLVLPQIPVQTFYEDTLKQVLSSQFNVEMGIGSNKILIIENPQTIFNNLIEKANWLVYKKSTPNYYLSYFTDEANKFPNKKFLPSVDFSNETDKDGFMDSETFGADGILPRTLDVLNWKSNNLGGIAYYNIQANYLDITGNITYSRLKKIIHQLQGK